MRVCCPSISLQLRGRLAPLYGGRVDESLRLVVAGADHVICRRHQEHVPVSDVIMICTSSGAGLLWEAGGWLTKRVLGHESFERVVDRAASSLLLLLRREIRLPRLPEVSELFPGQRLREA